MAEMIDDARRLIESRLSEIEAETKRLEGALTSLAGQAMPRRPRRARKVPTGPPVASTKPRRASGSRRKAVKRAGRGERREQLLAAIKANPGARPSELAESIGIRPAQVSVLIAKARSDQLIVKRDGGYALKS